MDPRALHNLKENFHKAFKNIVLDQPILVALRIPEETIRRVSDWAVDELILRTEKEIDAKD